jgi:hypothetical protein
MSESWKNRFWQLVLVCTFAVVLSVCNKAVNSSSNGSGTAFADGSTVTISSQALPTISHIMFCTRDPINNSEKVFFSNCDSTDSTAFESVSIGGSTYAYGIYLDDLHSAGFRPCPGVQAG